MKGQPKFNCKDIVKFKLEDITVFGGSIKKLFEGDEKTGKDGISYE